MSRLIRHRKALSWTSKSGHKCGEECTWCQRYYRLLLPLLRQCVETDSKTWLTNLYNNLVNQVIVNAFNLLRANVPDPALNQLLDYLEQNYVHGRQQQQQQLIGGNVIQQKLPPQPPPPDVWNVHNVTLAEGS